MLRKAIGAPWLGWVTVVVAAVNGVAVWIEVTFSTYHGKAWNAVGWGAFIGFLVVILVTSISLLARPATVPAGARSMAIS